MAAEAQTSRATIEEVQNFRGILRIENGVAAVLGGKMELFLHPKVEMSWPVRV
jgi:hypothetical protein